MKILDLVQGTPEWHAFRRDAFTASDAPAVMGDSPYKTRDQLLDEKKTGITPDVTPAQQHIFDKGHAAEAAARPIIERRIGEELYPVTGMVEIEGIILGASFDGLTMLYDKNWEHKLYNKELFDLVSSGGELTGKHYWQLEHQLIVSEAEFSIFTVSDGTERNEASLEYYSQPERRKALIDAWLQFKNDLVNHIPAVKIEKAKAKSIDSLPALVIDISGEVRASNLDVYRENALVFFDGINTDLQTDQDFVDAKEAVKFLDKMEKELDRVKKETLSKQADIEEVFRLMDDMKANARKVRLDLDKKVKSETANRKNEIVMEGKAKNADLLAQIQLDMPEKVKFPELYGDYSGAIKGKKTIATMQSAINDELARVNIELTNTKNLILNNHESYQDLAKDYEFLFLDINDLLTKDPNTLEQTIKYRIMEHKNREREKAEQLQREQEAKDKAEAERKAAEEQKKAEEAAQPDISTPITDDMLIIDDEPPAGIEHYQEQPVKVTPLAVAEDVNTLESIAEAMRSLQIKIEKTRSLKVTQPAANICLAQIKENIEGICLELANTVIALKNKSGE